MVAILLHTGDISKTIPNGEFILVARFLWWVVLVSADIPMDGVYFVTQWWSSSWFAFGIWLDGDKRCQLHHWLDQACLHLMFNKSVTLHSTIRQTETEKVCHSANPGGIVEKCDKCHVNIALHTGASTGAVDQFFQFAEANNMAADSPYLNLHY